MGWIIIFIIIRIIIISKSIKLCVSEPSYLDHFITTIAFVCLFWHGCGDAGMIGLHNIDAPIQLSPSSQQVERYYLSCPVWLIYLWLSLNIVEHLYIFEYFHIFEYLYIFEYLNIFVYLCISWISLHISWICWKLVQKKKTFPVWCLEGERLNYIAILQYCNIESYGGGQRPRGGNDQHSVILGNIPICAHFSFLRIKTLWAWCGIYFQGRCDLHSRERCQPEYSCVGAGIFIGDTGYWAEIFANRREGNWCVRMAGASASLIQSKYCAADIAYTRNHQVPYMTYDCCHAIEYTLIQSYVTYSWNIKYDEMCNKE